MKPAAAISSNQKIFMFFRQTTLSVVMLNRTMTRSVNPTETKGRATVFRAWASHLVKATFQQPAHAEALLVSMPRARAGLGKASGLRVQQIQKGDPSSLPRRMRRLQYGASQPQMSRHAIHCPWHSVRSCLFSPVGFLTGSVSAYEIQSKKLSPSFGKRLSYSMDTVLTKISGRSFHCEGHFSPNKT